MIHEAFRSAMKQCWTMFIDNVEPRDVIDRLFQGEIVTEDEQERVLLPSETRMTRCRTLADILRRRIASKPRLDILLDALNGSHYDYIAAEISDLISQDCSLDDDLAKPIQVSFESPGVVCPTVLTGSFGDVVESFGDMVVSAKNRKVKLQRSISVDGQRNKTFVILSDELLDCDAGVCYLYMSGRSGHVSNSRGSELLKRDTQLLETIDPVAKTEFSAVSVNLQTGADSGILAMTKFAQQLIDSLKMDCLSSSVWHTDSGMTYCLQSPVVLPPSNHGRTFATPYYRQMFDALSAMVNSADTELFCSESKQLWREHSADPDALCILLYLQASSCIFASDFDGCRQLVKKGLQLTPFTRLPNQVTVQMLSLRVWHQLKEGRQYGSIQSSLDDAMQIICQDPVSCSGMAAGWIYVDEAKQLMSLTVSSTTNVGRTRKLLHRVAASYRMAIRHFMNDETHDGPYGYNFAAVKLAAALLACDDALRLVNIDDLCLPCDLKEAASLLKTVDNSPVGVAEVLQPLLLAAQADYKFRTNCPWRAYQLACQAKCSAEKLQLQEEISIAQARCDYYNPLSSNCVSRPPVVDTVQSKSQHGPRSVNLTSSHASDASCESSDSEDRRSEVRNRRRRQLHGQVASSQMLPRFFVCVAVFFIAWLFFTYYC